MEVSEIRRNGRVVSAGVPQKKAGAGLAARQSARADRLALSRQAVAYIEEQNRQLLEQAEKQAGGSGQEQMLKQMDKDLKKLDKCQKIYARVVCGDKVPPEDLQYLERCDPEGFKLALAMRRPKANPKEWESELDDEDRKALQSGEDMQLDSKSRGGARSGGAPAIS